jgi:hypothetical protein
VQEAFEVQMDCALSVVSAGVLFYLPRAKSICLYSQSNVRVDAGMSEWPLRRGAARRCEISASCASERRNCRRLQRAQTRERKYPRQGSNL